MKNLAIAAIVAIMAVAFTSCNNGPKAKLSNDIDSLSYAMGITQSTGLKEYLIERVGMDTAYIDEFIKGLNDGVNAGDDSKKIAYVTGVQIGQQIANQIVPGLNYEIFGEDSTQTLNVRSLVAGFVANLKGKNAQMTIDQAQMIAQVKMQEIKARTMENAYGQYKKQNQQYLAANAKKEGVVTLPSGVQYKVLTEGNGATPSDTSVVVVNYEGRNIEGQVFDSSYERGEPFTTACDRVIKGWTEVLTKMPVGSKWEVTIPASLAYGEHQQGEYIKPYSTLIFVIELLGIK